MIAPLAGTVAHGAAGADAPVLPRLISGEKERESADTGDAPRGSGASPRPPCSPRAVRAHVAAVAADLPCPRSCSIEPRPIAGATARQANRSPRPAARPGRRSPLRRAVAASEPAQPRARLVAIDLDAASGEALRQCVDLRDASSGELHHRAPAGSDRRILGRTTRSTSNPIEAPISVYLPAETRCSGSVP